MIFGASFFIKRSCIIYLVTFIMFKHVKVGKHIEYMRQKIIKNMLIGKFHPGIKCLNIFFSFFFHPGMKSHPCLFQRVFTREISSRDETRIGMKSSMSMVKCLLLFTRFCRDEISFQYELIPVKKLHPGINKKQKNI